MYGILSGRFGSCVNSTGCTLAASIMCRKMRKSKAIPLLEAQLVVAAATSPPLVLAEATTVLASNVQHGGDSGSVRHEQHQHSARFEARRGLSSASADSGASIPADCQHHSDPAGLAWVDHRGAQRRLQEGALKDNGGVAEGARHASSPSGAPRQVASVGAPGAPSWHRGRRGAQEPQFRAAAGDPDEAHADQTHPDRCQALVLHSVGGSHRRGGQSLSLVAEARRGQARRGDSSGQGCAPEHRPSHQRPLPSSGADSRGEQRQRQRQEQGKATHGEPSEEAQTLSASTALGTQRGNEARAA
eukprot:6460764-Amphidinium_carterae.1